MMASASSWAARSTRAASTDCWCASPGIRRRSPTPSCINGQTGVEDLPRVDFINTTPLPARVERRDWSRRLERAAPIRRDPGRRPGRDHAGRRGDAGHARVPCERVAGATREGDLGRFAHARRLFRNVILKPNQQEAEAACRRAVRRIDYPALRRHMEAPLMVVTHGGDGAWSIDARRDRWVPTRRWSIRWISAARATASRRARRWP